MIKNKIEKTHQTFQRTKLLISFYHTKNKILYMNGKKQCPLAKLWASKQCGICCNTGFIWRGYHSRKAVESRFSHFAPWCQYFSLYCLSKKKVTALLYHSTSLSIFFCSCVFFIQTHFSVFFFPISCLLYSCIQNVRRGVGRILLSCGG